MSYDVIAGAPICKHGMHLILGNRLTPELALEIIRVTDDFFWDARCTTEYELNVKRRLGVPLEVDFDRVSPDGNFAGTDLPALTEAQKIYRERWDAMPWEFLGCDQVKLAYGWCYPDGTIAKADEADGWVYTKEIWEECEALVGMFPEVDLSIAIWGDQHIFANNLITREAPESPWSASMRDAVRLPSHGIVVRGGRVEGVLGDDPRLFGGYGYATYVDAVEGTFRQHRRLSCRGVAESRFGDRVDTRYGNRYDRTGLPDTVIEGWIELARERGLVTA